MFGVAGCWPDVIRRTDYDRPTWHYQLGSSLTIGNVKVPKAPGPLPKNADLQTRGLHIAQAIELCRETLRSRSSPESDKAIAICWIAHLVADSHQPCHAGSLYFEGVFDTDSGDRGANSIPTKQNRNLHALWDGLLGSSYDAGDVARRAKEIAEIVKQAERSNRDPRSTDPLVWLAESVQDAKQFVYSPEVLSAVEAAKRGSGKVETVDLSEFYLKAAGALAQKRAALAADRLAELLEQDLAE